MESEQRSHIRVKDRIYLKVSKITQERHEELVDLFVAGKEPVWCETGGVFASQGNFRDSIRKIREKDATLAMALELIDNKLNMIINILEERGGTSGFQLHDVDISAAGLNVKMDELHQGEFLDMSIRILPEQFLFRALGEVVRLDECPDGGTSAGIEFTWLSESDREMLIEHIFNIQIVQLRMRRASKDR